MSDSIPKQVTTTAPIESVTISGGYIPAGYELIRSADLARMREALRAILAAFKVRDETFCDQLPKALALAERAEKGEA